MSLTPAINQIEMMCEAMAIGIEGKKIRLTHFILKDTPDGTSASTTLHLLETDGKISARATLELTPGQTPRLDLCTQGCS